ncbi:MAG: hypothetical protein H6718_26630 [Polyangiaceae bacterium]|nr:hypothetical protein [Polyangiaceae bacterium]
MLRSFQRAALLVTCTGSVVAACNVYDDSLLLPGDGGAGTNNGGTSGTGGSAGSGNNTSTDKFWNDMEGDNMECPTEGVPLADQRPSGTEDGDVGSIYVGIDRLRFGGVSSLEDSAVASPSAIDDQAWKGIGFNLDRSCNAASWPDGVLMGGAVDSCQGLKNRACKNEFQNVYDGDFCKDNAIGALFGIASLSPIVGNPFRLTEADWNCNIHKGAMTIIFKISGYNGKPDDSSVRLDMYSSTGVTDAAAWNCREGDTNTDLLDTTWVEQAAQALNKKYQFSKRDIDPAAPGVPNGEIQNSRWGDAGAYVRNGWVIAHLPPNAELWFNGLNADTPGMRLILQNTVIAAQLVQDPQSERWEFTSATMGGTIKPGDQITSFREIGCCENLCDSYTTIIGYLNQQVDMLANSNDPVPDATCDALSFGIDFTAKQLTPGPVVDVPAPPDVSGGKCGTPRNPDVPLPGCTCVAGGACTSGTGGTSGAGGTGN